MHIHYSKKIRLIFGIQVILLALFVSCGKEDDKVDPPISPSITDFFPKSVLPGDTITISGENFGSDAAAANVTLGDADVTVTSVTDSEIKFVLPENAATGALTASLGDVTKDFPEPVSVLNLYFLGVEIDEITQPKYWKGGVSTNLNVESNFESVYAMDIVDGKIYVTGNGVSPTGHRIAKYWVNGVGHGLSDGTTHARGTDINVVGSDVYVCGYRVNEQGTFVGKLWKNGEEIFSSEERVPTTFYAMDIFENSIYLAGIEGVTATYWKDGERVKLTDGTQTARVMDIKIVEGEVFMAGYEGKTAKYWKNEVGFPLQGVKSSSDYSEALSIAVENAKIYVCGYEKGSNGQNTALLWVNGVSTELTPSTTQARAVSVSVMNGNIYCAGYEYNETSGRIVGKYWRNTKSETVANGGERAELSAVFIAE